MTANCWLDPVQPGRIVRVLLESLAGDATVAVEGEPVALRGLRLESEPGARVGPARPFRAEHGPRGHMVILPLENRDQAEALCRLLAPGGELRSEITTIQIEQHGQVQFLAGDSFHRECVSVGPAIRRELLSALVRDGAIRAFYTPAEARSRLGGVVE